MASEKPWEDWPDTDIEAGIWVKEKGYFQGYSATQFGTNDSATPQTFRVVLKRAGIDAVSYISTNGKVTIGDAKKYLPNAKVSSPDTEILTRYRLAVMLYRHFVTPVNQDEIIIQKLEKWFNETWVNWQGVNRQPKLIGHAKVIVEDARQYNIPIWLCLGQGWWETQWYTTGMSLKYNQGWGMKDTQGWGEYTDKHDGFANYISIDESIHAYFRLMSSPKMPYRAWIDKLMAGDESVLRTILQAYCVNDIAKHLSTVRTVRGWCEGRGIN